jgi:hypothetical protein
MDAGSGPGHTAGLKNDALNSRERPEAIIATNEKLGKT